MDNTLTPTQSQDLDEALKRGSAFEEMVKSKGWEYLQAQYENRVRAFLNGILLAQDKPISAFENERYQLIGMKAFLNSIQTDLKSLIDFRKQDESRSKE